MSKSSDMPQNFAGATRRDFTGNNEPEPYKWCEKTPNCPALRAGRPTNSFSRTATRPRSSDERHFTKRFYSSSAGGSRLRASCSAAPLRVAALVSNNEDLNSLNSGWVKCVLPEGTMEPLTNC